MGMYVTGTDPAGRLSSLFGASDPHNVAGGRGGYSKPRAVSAPGEAAEDRG